MYDCPTRPMPNGFAANFCLTVVVYYCRTYYKSCSRGGRGIVEDMCYGIVEDM